MFKSNSIQPDVRPHEIAFIEASEKKRSRGGESPADFLDAVGGGDDVYDDDEEGSSAFSNSDVSGEEEEQSVASLNSVEMYNGILYGNTPGAGMPNGEKGHQDQDIDRLLRKHSSSYFLPDARCCFLLFWTIAALGIGILAVNVASSNEEANFTIEVRYVGRHLW
jgi:hypothetical protein